MLIKQTPAVNFINIYRERFSYKIVRNFAERSAVVRNFGAKNVLLYKKRARKMLMKLSPDVKQQDHE